MIGMKKLLLVVVMVAGIIVPSANAEEVRVVSTVWAPFVYEEGQEISGLATEIVRATLNRAGINTEIHLYPWKRAIQMAKDEPNTMIFPLIRNEERESQFIWAVPMFSVKVSLHKLKKRKDIIIHSLEDAKKYKIGVLREGAMHLMLLRNGFEDEKQLEPARLNGQNVQKLFTERIDLDADSSLVIAHEAKSLGFSASETEEVFPLFEDVVYVAFSMRTPKEYVERIKTAYDQLKAEGRIHVLVDKY
jgi:polar amino acid transport system substrate-binding protein